MLGPDRPDDDEASAGSLFEERQAEAVAPFTIELDTDDGLRTWTVEAVDSDGVCELDELEHPLDVVEALLGDELGEDVVDELEILPWSRTRELARDLRAHFSLPDLPPGLWTFLVEQIDLYGDAIDRDLALGGRGYTGGWDLLDWFRGRRPWPQLARLIGGLPEGSRYSAAILDDEELAAERLERGEERTGRSTPPLVGETYDRALLRALVSGMGRVEYAVYAAAAGKKRTGSPPKALPGPETAEDRLREAIGLAQVEEIFDMATPWWRDQDPDHDPPGFEQSPSGLFVPTN